MCFNMYEILLFVQFPIYNMYSCISDKLCQYLELSKTCLLMLTTSRQCESGDSTLAAEVRLFSFQDSGNIQKLKINKIRGMDTLRGEKKLCQN